MGALPRRGEPAPSQRARCGARAHHRKRRRGRRGAIDADRAPSEVHNWAKRFAGGDDRLVVDFQLPSGKNFGPEKGLGACACGGWISGAQVEKREMGSRCRTAIRRDWPAGCGERLGGGTVPLNARGSSPHGSSAAVCANGDRQQALAAPPSAPPPRCANAQVRQRSAAAVADVAAEPLAPTCSDAPPVAADASAAPQPLSCRRQ